MKSIGTITLLILLLLLLSKRRNTLEEHQQVNPILGDISYQDKFGITPEKSSNDFERIKTHLKYVENRLRSKDISGISCELQERRLYLLDLLHAYIEQGNFPKNYDYPDQRKPCFIDKNGTICAVGYLVEQTAGRKVAEQINAKFKYEYLSSMNDEIIDNWIACSGFTKEECAIIQPTYGPKPVFTYNYIRPVYGIASAAFIGTNMAMNTIHGIQYIKESGRNALPILGILSGLGQIALGIGNIPTKEAYYNGFTLVNEKQKNLSFLNIGIGSTTFFLSTWKLHANNKRKRKLTTWNIHGIQNQSTDYGVVLNMNRTF